ncbi:HAD family phosphatase [Streptomyces sp. ACA25]|uniref:HAD family hydrolase n=1 Tax=Streptomyces sp. ACA25 TaxID=3022596 RepID=UPI002307DC20|nr:HAD family phosphatase [Streptomyces sp. ACA25]MDB1086391.1 HAD family phosphatase [Streptomyces sp. ACA25]
MRRTPPLAWALGAIVFDCDGTLLDSERHWEEARERVMRAHGAASDPAFARAVKGLHYDECGRRMALALGRPALAGHLTGQLLDVFRELTAGTPTVLPGARELVERLSGSLPLAVASNCPRDIVVTGLTQAGLLRWFDHIVVPEGSDRPKPRPDVYLEAARRCGVPPGQTLAVEDSVCGMLAAARAGLRVLAVGPGLRDNDGDLVDLWVESLADTDLLAWAGGVERPVAC